MPDLQGQGVGVQVSKHIDTRPGTERLQTLTPDQTLALEPRAIEEVDCTYCSSKKGEACRVVLYGQREGGRLFGFAHIARRALVLTLDIEDEALFGTTTLYPAPSNLDDLLG